MAASLPFSCCLSRSCSTYSTHKVRRPLLARAQSFGEKGKSADIVDANMNVLKRRIEEVRIHERLNRYCRGGEGWNYPSGYDSKIKREKEIWESLEVASLMAWSLGYTFLCGTLCLCLLSMVAHLGQ